MKYSEDEILDMKAHTASFVNQSHLSKHEKDSLQEKEMGVYSSNTFCKDLMHKKAHMAIIVF